MSDPHSSGNTPSDQGSSGSSPSARLEPAATNSQWQAGNQILPEFAQVLVDSVSDYAIIMLDTEGRVLTWNKGAELINGYTADEIIGQPVTRFYPTEDIAVGKATRELDIAAHLGRFEEEGWRLRKGGGRFWASVVVTSLRDGAGQLFGYGKVIRDLTERKRSEERFRRAVDASPNGMLQIDRNGRVVFINTQIEKLFGYERREIEGQNIDMLVPQRFREGHPGFRGAFFTNPKSRAMGSGRDLYAQRKDGTEFPVEIGLNPIDTPEGLMVICSLVDITERKKAEDAVALAAKKLEINLAELEKANEEVRNFAYIVSHDLRAPLVNIQGFSGELRFGLNEIRQALDTHAQALPQTVSAHLLQIIDDDAVEAMNFIEAAVAKMDHQINAVLKLSRLGRQELVPELLDMGQLAQSLALSLRHDLDKCGGDIEISDLPSLQADRTAMEQIIGNLLGNAVKYRSNERNLRVRVWAELHAEGVTLHVADNGRGMDSEDVPRAFELFRRLGKQDTIGDGMGLPYVQTLVRRYRGHIWCDATPGQGCTFHVFLPNDLAPPRIERVAPEMKERP